MFLEEWLGDPSPLLIIALALLTILLSLGLGPYLLCALLPRALSRKDAAKIRKMGFEDRVLALSAKGLQTPLVAVALAGGETGVIQILSRRSRQSFSELFIRIGKDPKQSRSATAGVLIERGEVSQEELERVVQAAIEHFLTTGRWP